MNTGWFRFHPKWGIRHNLRSFGWELQDTTDGGQTMGSGSPSRTSRKVFVPGVLGAVAVLSAVLSAAGFAVLGSPAQSTPEYLSQFNAKYDTRGTKLDGCKTCHQAETGNAENLNVYGKDFGGNNHDFAAIEGKDSDGDSFSNIDEIKAATYPGDPNDNPNTKPAPTTTTSSTTTTTTRPFPFSLLPEGLAPAQK